MIGKALPEMANSPDSAESFPRRAVEAIRDHPYISAIILGCAAMGVVLAVPGLPADWALARRIAAGCVGGAGVGLIITASRIIG